MNIFNLKNQKTPLTLLAFIGIVFLGCNSSNSEYTNIEDFYYPIEGLTNGGLVYEFQPVINDDLTAGRNDSVYSIYYKCEYFPNDTPMFVITQFDEFCRQSILHRDKVAYNGTVQQGLRLFEYADVQSDSADVVEASILSGNVYPYEVRDSSAFLYKIKWTSKQDPLSTFTLTRKRMYKGKTTHFYKNVPYECVEFEVSEDIYHQHEVKGDFPFSYTKIERYAEGIGLVYFTALGGDGSTIAYQLVDTYPMEDLVAKCKKLFFDDY